MDLRAARFSLALCVVFGLAPPALAAEGTAGELGLQLGAWLPDEDLTGRPQTLDEIEPTFGFRGTYFFSPRWGWFVDALYSELETETAGDATWFAARTGVEALCFPHSTDHQIFFAFGGGWQATQLDGGADFDRVFGSLSLGQRFGVGANQILRWELRGDHTLTDDGLGGEDLTSGLLLVGLTWGAPSRGRDTDGDGVRDRKDDCPDTPRRVLVDAQGCPVDSDGDGVFDGRDLCGQTPAGWPVDAQGCPLDTDRDLVADGADRCPGTPVGVAVDDRGCPVDSDDDGVTDERDACPETPRGARVDARGCPLDADGDGVFDGIDRCPDTPRYAHVDEQGCPKDSDGDGVFDGIDRCPTTPPGSEVNAEGCPRAKPLFEEKRDRLVLEGVYFEVNQATLTANSRTVLDLVALSLRDWPEVHVEIGGHTDSSGSDAHNRKLSQQRAEAVRSYLIEKGIAPERLVARGYGESQPIADNKTREGKEKNRRVELRRTR